jgi:hypothetical protein
MKRKESEASLYLITPFPSPHSSFTISIYIEYIEVLFLDFQNEMKTGK